MKLDFELRHRKECRQLLDSISSWGNIESAVCRHFCALERATERFTDSITRTNVLKSSN